MQPHMMLEDLCRWTSAELKRRANRKVKMKGKSKTDNSFQKGKGKVKDKFSTSSTGKGKGRQPLRGICLYCGKAGHWKRDCRKYKHDQETGQVRQVESSYVQNTPSPPPMGQNLNAPQQQSAQQPVQSHVTFMQPSPHTAYVQQPQQTVGNVRRFEFAPDWSDETAGVVTDGP